MSKHFLLALCAALTLAATGCGGGGGGSSTDTSNEPQITDTDSDGVADSDDNCPDDANADQTDTDANGEGDACDPIPTRYSFDSKITSGESAVSYTGQTTRHVMIADITTMISNLTEAPGDSSQTDEIVSLYENDGSFDLADYLFSLSGESVTPGPTYGDISTGKALSGKIAGADKAEHILGDGFFGWTDGFSGTTPDELFRHFMALLEDEVTNREAVNVPVSGGGSAQVSEVYIDQYGRDFKQLVQKFLLGAVAFSQGTADYLQTDFAGSNTQDDDSPFTVAEHKWDEAFGYFGAARDYLDYSDDEIAAKGGRADYANGYHDSNGDGLIDLRDEYNFGNAVNCGKRDRGTTANSNPTDLTQAAMEAFILGRKIVNNFSDREPTEAELSLLETTVANAALTWEKCVAATVVHYINDVIADIDGYDNGAYSDVSAYKDLAKHWSEMKGFALGLQFSPASPFRNDTDVSELATALELMGDAPVLADGTQLGEAYEGGASQYQADLLEARNILELAYEFDEENVANW